MYVNSFALSSAAAEKAPPPPRGVGLQLPRTLNCAEALKGGVL
jgi:hypothetical protein